MNPYYKLLKTGNSQEVKSQSMLKQLNTVKRSALTTIKHRHFPNNNSRTVSKRTVLDQWPTNCAENNYMGSTFANWKRTTSTPKPRIAG